MMNLRWAPYLKSAWIIPVLAISFLSLLHLVFNNYGFYITRLFSHVSLINIIEHDLYYTLITLCTYWLCARLINASNRYLNNTSLFQKHVTLAIVIPFFSALSRALIFLVLFNIVTPQLVLLRDVSHLLNKLSSILIICGISWILFKLIDISEQLLLNHYRSETQGSNTERKVYTQTLILKRVAYAIISVLTAGSVLILFDNVRALGASVLTTAGVFGLILTFTAQRSLASIFSSLEIALTQPIKIGDTVVIENENGTIEEINFRHVIVKLGDWRRLVVPTNFFLDKSFQNWSRLNNANLVGTVFLYVDFTLPMPEIRYKLGTILKNCPLWDANVGTIQVSDLQERVMQLKVSASARNPDDVSKLRAHLREELMSYIVKNHPHALPKTRSYSVKNDFEAVIASRKESISQEA